MPRYKTFSLNQSYLYLSDQKTSQLINLYRSHEELWNTNLEIYNRKQPRIEALKKIAKILDVEYFGPTQVNTKISNLRNMYRQERKKKLTDENYVPSSAWYNRLDSFLRPHVKMRIHKGKTIDDVHSDEFGENRYDDVQISNVCHSSVVVKQEPSKEQKESDVDQDYESDCSEQEASSDHQDAEVPFTDHFFDKSVPKTLKSISERLEELNPTENTHDQFGLQVASLLRDLPKKKTLILQPQIVNIVIVAIDEEMAEKSTSKIQVLGL